MVSRSLVYRLAAAVAAVAAAAAAPGVALGHGIEHQRAAHHHTVEFGSRRSSGHVPPVGSVVAASLDGSDRGDHAHLRIEIAPTGRLGTWTLTALPPAVVTDFHSYLSVTRSPADTGEPERPSTPRGPPPKLRSPPLR